MNSNPNLTKNAGRAVTMSIHISMCLRKQKPACGAGCGDHFRIRPLSQLKVVRQYGEGPSGTR